jgi:AraC-like DNA-binding protein
MLFSHFAESKLDEAQGEFRNPRSLVLPSSRLFLRNRISSRDHTRAATINHPNLMRYQEYYPNPPLNRFVECFWTLEGATGTQIAEPDRVLPDGCAEVILNFGDRFVAHDGHTRHTQPFQFLVGQITKPMLISPTGQVELIGIRFHPGGTAPFFHVPMEQVTNQAVELKLLSQPIARSIAERVEHLATLPQKIFELERILTHAINMDNCDLALLSLANHIVLSGGVVSVDDLADSAGVSNRQLERRFLREIGVGPKVLCRILRFQQVFRVVESEPTWATVAVDCGYYDQAHLIRDFRQFADQTPVALFDSQSALTEAFTRKNRTSDFSNTSNR